MCITKIKLQSAANDNIGKYKSEILNFEGGRHFEYSLQYLKISAKIKVNVSITLRYT